MSPIPASAAEVEMLKEIWQEHIDSHANEMHVLFSRQIDRCFDEIFHLARADPITDDMRQMVDDLRAADVKIERRPLGFYFIAPVRSF